MSDTNTVMLTAVPRPLGNVPAPATGAPRNSANIRQMAQALLDMIAGGVLMSTPTGTVAAYAGAAPPEGWLLCDGRAVSRADYAALYTVLGTRYGNGNNTTTFNLPDLRGRSVLGAGQGSDLTNRPLATRGGAETHALTQQEMPAHRHNSATGIGNPGTGNWEVTSNLAADKYEMFDYDPPVPTTSTGGNLGHNNMQPFLSLTYIIRS